MRDIITRFLIYILLVSCFLNGCHKDSRLPAPLAESATRRATSTPAIDATTAFGSPEAMGTFLEQRWPLDAIKGFCTPERRHNNAYQNLVAGFDGPVVWHGTLYPNSVTSFEKIAWYANTKNGRATTFSLGVERGRDFWLLEIGTEESIKTPPDFLPDPNRPQFVGHK